MGDEALSAGAVARRLGVAVTTLRTWHRRYGLGPSRHSPGQHRRYTAEDLSRLEIMRRLTAQGVAPAEAARWARRAPQSGGAPAGGAPEREVQPGLRQQSPSGRAGGGRNVPVPGAGPAARGLARAAMRLDSASVRSAIGQLIAGHGVVAAWEQVIGPVLSGIGERHATTGRYIDVEHLVSRCVSEAFTAVPRPLAATGPARILLACADEEQHTLPLEALAAALAEAGVDSRLLGARVPVPALREAVGRTGPAAVVLWSHAPDTGDPVQLAALLSGPRRPLLLVAAGPGWPAEGLPDGVARPGSLAEAVSLTRALHESAERPAAD